MSGLDNGNPLRGETKADLGGSERVLRLTIGQLERLEGELGYGAPEMLTRLGQMKYTVRELRTIIAEGLRKTPEHPRPDMDTVWLWITEDILKARLIAADLIAVALGFGALESEDENPPKAGGESV